MNIIVKNTKKKFVAEVWSSDGDEPLVSEGFLEPYPEDVYVDLNQWCIDNLGYHARTAYHVFEFEKRSDLDWFLLRWN